MATRRIQKELQQLDGCHSKYFFISPNMQDVIVWVNTFKTELLINGYIRNIKRPHHSISLQLISICQQYYSESNIKQHSKTNALFKCYGAMLAPSDSPYCGGIFFFRITLSEDYPFKPPHSQFITPLYHCNVTNDGQILLDILTSSKWSPTFNISMILSSIYQLLSNPNIENTLNNASVFNVYQNNRKQYEITCREWTKQYASLTQIHTEFPQRITSINSGYIKPNKHYHTKHKYMTSDVIESKAIQIFIKVSDSKTISLNVLPNYTILIIKGNIKYKEYIPRHQQRLFYGNIELNDKHTLMDYNITEQSVIDLVLISDVNYIKKYKIKKNDGTESRLLGQLISTVLVNVVELNNIKEIEKEIINLFWNTMNKNIYKISMMLKVETKYQKNIAIFNKLQKELLLFHGTSVENGMNIICNGFNQQYNIRSAYGKGTYFAKYASKAAQYAVKKSCNGYYMMLVCRVIVGNYTDDKLLYKTNNKYDSFVNNLNNPSIFVINKDYMALPLYIIMFKNQPTHHILNDDNLNKV